MKLICTPVLALIGLWPYALHAQTIAFNNGSPTTAAGTVNGAGTYDCGAGNTLDQIKLIATRNGVDTVKVITIIGNPQMGPWTAVINNLAAGKYDVSVQLYYKNNVGMVFKNNPVKAANNPYNVP